MRASILVVILSACGSAPAPSTAAPEPQAPDADGRATVAEVEGEGDAEPAVSEPAVSDPAVSDPAVSEPRSASAGPSDAIGAGDGGDDPSCGEEAERDCQMRGGNCRLVMDSPCVGRGTRCQDWEMDLTAGCVCHCEQVDREGRPILPR